MHPTIWFPFGVFVVVVGLAMPKTLIPISPNGQRNDDCRRTKGEQVEKWARKKTTTTPIRTKSPMTKGEIIWTVHPNTRKMQQKTNRIFTLVGHYIWPDERPKREKIDRSESKRSKMCTKIIVFIILCFGPAIIVFLCILSPHAFFDTSSINIVHRILHHSKCYEHAWKFIGGYRDRESERERGRKIENAVSDAQSDQTFRISIWRALWPREE